MDIVHEFSLKQHVGESTRHGSRESVLDLVFSSDDDLVHDVRVCPGISDHEIVQFNVVVKCHTKNAVKLKNYYYGSADAVLMQNAFRCINWDEVLGCNEVTEAWLRFVNL